MVRTRSSDEIKAHECRPCELSLDEFVANGRAYVPHGSNSVVDESLHDVLALHVNSRVSNPMYVMGLGTVWVPWRSSFSKLCFRERSFRWTQGSGFKTIMCTPEAVDCMTPVLAENVLVGPRESLRESKVWPGLGVYVFPCLLVRTLFGFSTTIRSSWLAIRGVRKQQYFRPRMKL